MAGPSPDLAALEQLAPLFDVTDIANQLEFIDQSTDSLGRKRNRYRQMHRDVPVFSGILHVHLAHDGLPISANGRIYPIPASLNVLPTITADAAGIVAEDMMGDGADAVETGLVVVDPAWYGDAPTGVRLAYHVAAAGSDFRSLDGFFIDAHTGEVLDRWSMMCTALDRRIYDAFGLSELPGAQIRAEGDPPSFDPEIDRLYDYLGDAYDYFQLAFGRDSYDNLGSPIVASAYYDSFNCGFSPNASWSPVLRQMYFCQEATYDDVIAHELTHGVTQYSANLIYQNQPGQLNESFSDIFGELVDLFNGGASFSGTTGATPWVAHPSGSGGDMPNPHRTAICSPAAQSFPDGLRWVIAEDSPAFSHGLRDMWSPSCFQHPDKASSLISNQCPLLDNGGVHTGSGVPNHAFAIACDGKTFNGQTVTGIGPIKAGAIWYRALTTYLTVASDFEDAYIAINQAAADLVGTTPLDPRTGTPSSDPITAADAAEVDKALLAVELEMPGVCGESVPVLNGSAPPECQTAVTYFFDDFESGGAGWTVENTATTAPYDWALSSALPFDRSGTAFFCADMNVGVCSGEGTAQAVHSLTSPAIAVPPGQPTVTLRFTHFVETEPRFDGGNVSIRVDNGPWQLVPAGSIYYNSYNSTLFAAALENTNPRAGEAAYTGVGGSWGATLVDLGSFGVSGSTIQVRFDFSKDNCFGFTGWYVDDVSIFGCSSSGDCDRNGVPDEMDAILGTEGAALTIQTPNNSSGNLSDADPHPSLGVNKVADNFAVQRAASIETVLYWGGYTGNTPVADLFTINIYTAAGDVPGTLVASRAELTPQRTATGRTFFNVGEHAYEVALAQPIELAPGVYFLELFNNTAGFATTWIWERALFGWVPGSALLGQGCTTYCASSVTNFSLELRGRYDGILRADADLNLAVSMDDIAPFVEALLHDAADPDLRCAVDINRDGRIDGEDVGGFVECVLASGCP